MIIDSNPINKLLLLEQEVIVVSKKQAIEDISFLKEVGFSNFAENRVDELETKFRLLRELNIQWHFIGNIQSKDLEKIVNHSDISHSICRKKEIILISKFALAANKTYQCFIQVNISGEKSKSGLPCDNWEYNKFQITQLFKLVSLINELPNIKFLGLMTMAPETKDINLISDIFKRCNELLRQIENMLNWEKYTCKLSMGMSSDYNIAINQGANYIRIGSLLFNNIKR